MERMLLPGVGQPGADWAPTVILPANHNALRSWWESDTSEPIVLVGHGFDTNNGIAIGLFCACQDGQVSSPGHSPKSSTQ